MQVRRARPIVLASLLALFATHGPGLAKSQARASWLDREIRIDGELDEWRDTLEFQGAADSFIGAFNDAQSLYLCFYSRDPEVGRQVLTDGLRVKLQAPDDSGITVRFPLGSLRGAERAGADVVPDPVVAVEVLVSGRRDPVVVAAGPESGLELQFSVRGSFFYELKLPLARTDDRPWGLGAVPGDRLKIVFENPRIDNVGDERAARRAPETAPAAFGATGAGGLGETGEPGWGGGLQQEDPGPLEPLVFVFKARLQLSAAP